MELHAGLEVHGIHDDVVVFMLCVHVCRHQTLVAFEVRGELQSDLMHRFEVHRIIGSERLDDVIVGAAIGFMKPFFYCFKFMHRSPGHAVDAGDEFVGRFLAVGHIVNDTTQTT